MAKAMSAQEKKWEVEDAARTLKRAEEIKVDSGLYKKAMAQLEKEQKAILKAVSSLKAK